MITNNNSQKEAYKKPPFFISYLITDPKEYGNTIEIFGKNFTKSLSLHKVDIVCFRDKLTPNTLKLAKSFKTIAKEFNIDKIIINNDIEQAIKLELDGVHLTSQQFDKIHYTKQRNLYTIISCHTEDEIELAKQNGADMVTYSPIFYKENKGDPKGCENLKNIVQKYQDNNFKIIALGGITTKEQITQIKNTHCSGFASIRYFTK